MKLYVITEPVRDTSCPVWTIHTREGILLEYWNYWNRRQSNTEFKELDDPVEKCIEDYVTMHYAQILEPHELPEFFEAQTKWMAPPYSGD